MNHSPCMHVISLNSKSIFQPKMDATKYTSAQLDIIWPFIGHFKHKYELQEVLIIPQRLCSYWGKRVRSIIPRVLQHMYPIYGWCSVHTIFSYHLQKHSFSHYATQIMHCFCLKWTILHCIQQPVIIDTFIFIHLADAFIQSDLQVEEYNKRYIIKRQTVTGSACHTHFKALFRAKN